MQDGTSERQARMNPAQKPSGVDDSQGDERFALEKVWYKHKTQRNEGKAKIGKADRKFYEVVTCFLPSRPLSKDQIGDEESIETDEDETHIPAESEIAAVCVVEVVCVVTVEAPMSITN
ncbi:hypothetical protein HGM15179_016494, partial [Zosterops borbonicus]